MKKFNFALCALAFATIALVSCKEQTGGGNNPNSPVTGIKITPNTLELAEGESVRLQYTLEPAGATATIAWTSTDTNVVYVLQNGSIEALSQGVAKVAATAGNYSDTCVVTVKPYLETLTFTSAFIYDLDTLYYGENGQPRIDTLTDYVAYRTLCEVWLFTDGFYVNNSGYLDGSQNGAVIELKAPMHYTTKYLNNGEQGALRVLGDWIVDETNYNAGRLYAAAPGTVDEPAYISTMENVFTALNTGDAAVSDYLDIAGSENISGTVLRLWETSTNDDGSTGYASYYVPEGIITSALLSLNNDFPTSDYMCGLDYNVINFTPLMNDNEQYTWGCKYLFDEVSGNISLADRNVHYGTPIVYEYGEVPTQSQEMKAIKVNVMTWEHPEQAAQLKAQIQNHQIRVKK